MAGLLLVARKCFASLRLWLLGRCVSGRRSILSTLLQSRRRTSRIFVLSSSGEEMRRSFIAAWAFASGGEEWLASTAQVVDGCSCVLPHAEHALHLSSVALGAAGVARLRRELDRAPRSRLLLLVDVGRHDAPSARDLTMLGWAWRHAFPALPVEVSLRPRLSPPSPRRSSPTCLLGPVQVVQHIGRMLAPGELRDEHRVFIDLIRSLAADGATSPLYVVLCYRDAAFEGGGYRPASWHGTPGSRHRPPQLYLPPNNIAAGGGERSPRSAALLLNRVRRRFEECAEAECDALLAEGVASAQRAGGTLVATAAPRSRMVIFAPSLVRRAGRRGLDAFFSALSYQLLTAS